MIKKIKWDNHVILGDLELDLTKPDGSSYKTIILAGENGTGKTTILETLATFLNLGTFEPFDSIEYSVNEEDFLVNKIDERNSRAGFHNRRRFSDESIQMINTSRHNNFDRLKEDLEDLRHYGVVYSKARSGFNTKKVISTTIQQLDNEIYEVDDKDDFTSIKQLIVDINAQDNSDWMRKSKSGEGMTIEEFIPTSKLFRFTNAFNGFFDNLEFTGIDDNDPTELKIEFKKHDKNISLDDLSTGEKQIVFRGSQVLKNVRGVSKGVVLIDEPELSMHPKWQEKILDYYMGLFSVEGEQKGQMFFATHSEYIIKSALAKDDVLIIILNDNEGMIEPKRITAPSVLPTVTAAETNYLAFGIASIDYHIELYGFLQNKANCTSIKDCDDYIASQTGIYDPSIHEIMYTYTNPITSRVTTYNTLPTYIRNIIDHPDSTYSFTKEQLECSIKLLIELCR